MLRLWRRETNQSAEISWGACQVAASVNRAFSGDIGWLPPRRLTVQTVFQMVVVRYDWPNMGDENMTSRIPVGWYASALASLALLVTAACSKKEDKPAVKETPAAAATEKPKETKPAYPAVAEPPKSLGKLKVPDNNPITPAKVALGNKLFFDKRLSVDGSRACYSCHQNEQGTGGKEPRAIGAKEKQLTRHSPVLWNVGYFPAFYWDGRAGSLEAQAKGAWGGGNMGVGKDNLQKKADEIGALPEYKQLFADAFPGEGATADTIAMALASYERTLFCGDTAFDKFEAGDQGALSDEQKKGWELFKAEDKGNCAACHTPPFFSDAYKAEGGAYHNVGIGIEGKKPDEVDVGRQKVTKSESDFASFKTPSLRNVTRTAPYFHDGSIATLEEAVNFMASGGYPNKNLDPKLVKMKNNKLADDELKAIIAFLGALECSGKLTEAK